MNEKDLNAIIKQENHKRLIGIILVAVGFLSFLFIPFVGIIVVALGFILFITATNNLKKKVGITLTNEVLKEYFANFAYDPKNGINYEFLKSLDMALPSFDRLTSNDSIKAIYRDHEIMMCDLTLEERYVHDGKTSYTTVFQGPFIEISYDKDIKNSVTVAENKFTIFKDTIKTESEEFNRRFNVYSTSEHDAFYILTPQMMERVSRVNDLAGDDIFINFNVGKLYFAIDNRHNNFELNFSQKSVDDIKRDFKADLDYILQVLDELLEGLD